MDRHHQQRKIREQLRLILDNGKWGGGERFSLTLKLSTHSGQLYGYFKREGRGKGRTLK